MKLNIFLPNFFCIAWKLLQSLSFLQIAAVFGNLLILTPEPSVRKEMGWPLSHTITWSQTGPGRPARSCGAVLDSTDLTIFYLGQSPGDAVGETTQTGEHLKYARADRKERLIYWRQHYQSHNHPLTIILHLVIASAIQFVILIYKPLSSWYHAKN